MTRFGMFAKYWEVGAVKTRLAGALGAVAAARMYRLFVELLVRRFEAVADQRVLCYWPPQRRSAFADLAGASWELLPQSDGDLGRRMRGFLRESLDAGYTRTVLIGSDSPTLPAAYVDRAFRLLDEHSVVMGPTVDGGYYLIGVAGTVPPIFEGVAWSTPHVWQQTVERLHRAHVAFAELPEWYDVDEAGDLPRLRDELSELSRESPLWGALLAAVDELRGTEY